MRSLFPAILALSLSAAAQGGISSVTMSGFVTQMPPLGWDLPAPWNAAVVGDPWSLTLTYEDGTVGIPAGSQTMFPGFARSYAFTLGAASAFGALPANPTVSQAFLQNSSIDYLGFDFIMTQGPVRFGLGLTDQDGTAFNSQSALPTTFATQDFEIRDAGIWRLPAGAPQVAMRFSITSIVPAPVSATLPALGMLAATRRRSRTSGA